MDKREHLIEVFNDTQRFMRENVVLAAAVEKSKAAASKRVLPPRKKPSAASPRSTPRWISAALGINTTRQTERRTTRCTRKSASIPPAS